VDRIVAGAAALRLERPADASPLADVALADARPVRGDRATIDGAVLDDIERPRFRARVCLATWSQAVFEVTTERRTIFASVPRSRLASFLRVARAGRLDRLITGYANAGDSGRLLTFETARHSASLHDSLGPIAAMVAPERPPLWTGTGADPQGKRATRGPARQPVPAERVPWRRLPRVIGGAAIATVAAVAIGVGGWAIVEGGRRPDVQIDPTSVAFGAVEVGSPSSRVVELTNTGSADLEIRELVLSPRQPGLRLDGECPSRLPAGDTCTITLRLTAAREQAYQSSLRVFTNAEPATHSVTITGQVVIPRVAVPDVRGLRDAVAQRRIEAAGLKVGDRRDRFNARLGAGLVIRTIPAAGTTVPVGAAVVRIVSRGPTPTPTPAPTPVTVPDIVGLTESDARDVLRGVDLRLGAVERVTRSAPIGTVVSQDPPPGARVPAGDTIQAVVEAGVVVPDVTGMIEGQALDTLQAVGLDVSGSSHEYHDTIPAGSVIRSVPGAGNVVSPAEPIRLVVSRGREPVVD
jgi:beta-lactam-binding protein with PASTA domain